MTLSRCSTSIEIVATPAFAPHMYESSMLYLEASLCVYIDVYIDELEDDGQWFGVLFDLQKWRERERADLIILDCGDF